MYRCEKCGKEFATTQGRGGHAVLCQGNGGLVVREAQAIVRAQGSPALRAQGSALEIDTNRGLRAQGSGLVRAQPWQPLETRLEPRPSLQEMKAEVDELEPRSKLAKRRRYIKGEGWRIFGIVMIIAGVAVLVINGAKMKLPFIGEVE